MSRASTSERSNSEDSHSQSCLTEVLRNCADIQSLESLSLPHSYDYNERKMISPNPYSFSGNVSNSSCASEDVSFTDCILEDNGRISLAYENLRSIPRRLADKFAAQTKCLDLSHNDFRDLKFLSFFEDLDTLILDRNVNLDLNTLPYLPSLNILWINNCDVSNITDWIHRIERHCPALEQLSCMGNPGIRNVFGSQGAEMAVARDYILQVLPNLKYLDGVPVPVSQKNGNGSHSALSPSQMQCQDSTSHSGSGKISTPTLAFKNLFRLKQSPKPHGPGGVRSEQMFGNGSSTN